MDNQKVKVRISKISTGSAWEITLNFGPFEGVNPKKPPHIKKK